MMNNHDQTSHNIQTEPNTYNDAVKTRRSMKVNDWARKLPSSSEHAQGDEFNSQLTQVGE
jgi:hypothetical protein